MTLMQRLYVGLVLLALAATPVAAQLGSVPHTFSVGQVTNPTHVNTMFSAIYANACNRTGCTLTGPMTTLALLPTADNISDLGSAALSYNDIWIDGTATIATLAATTITGAISTTSRITATVTTEQLRAAYDGSNYASFTVGSTGGLTLNMTGAGEAFTISDPVTASTTLSVGTTSTFTGVAAFTAGLKERGRTALIGEWTNQAYASGEYTASASTWTVDSGDVTLNRYMLVGKTVTWQLTLAATDVGGTPAHLRVAVPGSLTEVAALSRGGSCGYTADAGTVANQSSYWIMDASGYVKLFLFTGGNWTTTAADNTAITCTIVFEIA